MSLPYVLVIEDELPTQRAILKLLSVLEYEAAAVTTAVEAITQVQRRQPDVVISDFVLPSFDGLWFLKQVRQRFPALPVILTTGTVLPESIIREAKSLGAVAFLGKPFTREELDRAIRQAMNLIAADQR